jgi:type IV pilus assembly protein PilM
MAIKKITALDFGAEFIKLCEVEYISKTKFRVVNFLNIPIPILSLSEADVSKERVIDWDKLGGDLKQKKIEKNFSCEDIILSPQGKDVNTYIISLPFVKKSDIKLLVEREIRRTIAIPADHPQQMSYLKLDEHIKERRKFIDVLVAIASKDAMLNYMDFCENVGLKTKFISIKALSLYSFMKSFYPKEENIAVIDIGSDITTIIIIKNKKLRFMRSMYIAIKEFKTNLMNKLSLTSDEAESMMERFGVGFEEGEDSLEFNRYKKVVLPLRDRFSAELHRSMLYYQERMGIKEKLSHIYICGTGAFLKGIDEALKKRVGIEVSMLSFPDTMELIPEIEKEFKENFLGFVVSLGLACLPQEKEIINLIPKKAKKKVGKKIYFVLTGLLLANLFLLDMNFMKYKKQLNVYNATQNKLKTNLKSYPKDLEKVYQEVSERRRIFEETLNLFYDIQVPQPDWQKFFVTIAKVLDPKILITDFKMEYNKSKWEFDMRGKFSGTYPEAQFVLRKTRLKFEESHSFENIDFEIEKRGDIKLSQKTDYSFTLKGVVKEDILAKRELR